MANNEIENATATEEMTGEQFKDWLEGISTDEPDEQLFQSSSSRNSGANLVHLSDEQREHLQKMHVNEIIARALLAKDQFQGVHVNAVNWYEVNRNLSVGHKATMLTFLVGQPHTLAGQYDEETGEIVSLEEMQRRVLSRKAEREQFQEAKVA